MSLPYNIVSQVICTRKKTSQILIQGIEECSTDDDDSDDDIYAQADKKMPEYEAEKEKLMLKNLADELALEAVGMWDGEDVSN